VSKQRDGDSAGRWPALSIFDQDCSEVGNAAGSLGAENNALTLPTISLQYVAMKYKATQAIDRELKKGSAELLILSLIEHRARHGYEIGKLIDERSKGVLKYNIASFYPLLYRLEARGLIEGRWVEKAGQRRRRYYKLTTKGKKMLEAQRSTWANLVNAIRLITEAENA
jgi:PadR family transcriptional regulator, regulatory protein PadR